MRGQIVALATQVIPPESTPEKRKAESLIAHPRWKYKGPACTINFEWQIGRWQQTAGIWNFDGISNRVYATRSQTPSMELTEFTTDLPAIPLSPLSLGYYDCEIWFKSSAFSDLRVIVQNCVRVVEEVIGPPTKIVGFTTIDSAKVGEILTLRATIKNYSSQAVLAKVEGELLGYIFPSEPKTFTIGAGKTQEVTLLSFAMPDRDMITFTISSFHQEGTNWIKDDSIKIEIMRA